MMQKLLIIIWIIVTGIDYYFALSYLNYSGTPCLSHRSIRPSPPSEFDFIYATNMKSPEVNTCEGFFLNSNGTLKYKGYV